MHLRLQRRYVYHKRLLEYFCFDKLNAENNQCLLHISDFLAKHDASFASCIVTVLNINPRGAAVVWEKKRNFMLISFRI